MKALHKRLVLWILAALFVFLLFMVRERRVLQENIIRLHVVGATDLAIDQSIKLEVRDAVLDSLSGLLSDVSSKEEAKQIIENNMDTLEHAANRRLTDMGSMDSASISFEKEPFPIRYYDTFSLPAGVYDSLRITIGKGEGRNWWCVVFPSFCVSATSAEFRDIAVSAGFSTKTADALAGEYEIRFFFLECIGEIENFLYDLQ